MIDLCIDARMAFSAGIGTCIRTLVPLLNCPPFKVILLVDRPNQSWCVGFEQIVLPASIYSVQEQLLFPLKIPKCDLFWSPHYNVPLLPIRAKKRAVTIHDACHLALGQLLSPLERLYAKVVMKRALHRSHAVITDSVFSQEELIRYLGKPKNPIEVIHVAVDQKLFQKEGDFQKLEKLRNRYALPENFFLYVGNLKAHKNLSGLLNAFGLLTLKNWGLVLIGKTKGLRNSINAIPSKNVLLLDEISDEELPIFYRLAKALVFPSFYEGFGLPPLEAMSCGCPTVVSNAASLPEICGDATLYVDPHNIDHIASAMHRVASDEILSKCLVEAGLERVKKFSWERTGDQYRRFFEKVHHA